MPKTRASGLWEVVGDDATRVIKAKEHLISLLDDPYYYEAYQIMLREKHPKLRGVVGNRYAELGKLANKYQNPTPPKRPIGGRPEDPVTAKYRQILNGLQNKNGTLKSNCKKFIQLAYGDPNKSLVLDFYEKVRAVKRRDKEKG